MKIRNPKSEIRNYWQNQAGQVVLMLVLITIVGLTISLSLISRTVTDIRISSQIEQSGRAFSAAEAGVENALKASVIGGPTGTVSLPGASGSYSVSQVGGASAVLSFPVTEPGNAQTVWLTNHNANGTLNETSGNYPASSSLDICWGTDPNITPAIVISLYYKSGSAYKVARGAYDNNAASRGNGFATPDSAGNYCGSNFRFKKTITPTTDFGLLSTDLLLFLRVTPVYENAVLAVNPALGVNLPPQGKVITSIGQTSTGVVRKIQVTQGYNVLPPVLDFVLFGENQQ